MQNREPSSLARPESIIIEERNNQGEVVRRYNKGKFLGKGGFAKCYELTSLDSQKKWAVKVIEKASLTRSKAREKLNSQIKIHRSLKSQYVVGFHHFFEDDENVYIILELCSNQTLNELIKRRKRITQIQAKYYLFQIISGVRDIHNSNVIHRDLKLGDLFLTENLNVKIGDFGLAAKLNFDTERRKTMCGTPNYIAPQILENNGHSFEVDVWSLGVIAYAFVCGRPPFETNDVKTTYQKIKTCNYSFPDNVTLSTGIKRFITKMLIRDPSRRATIDEILNDEFFVKTSFPKTLPISLAACPPSSAFIKQYSESDSLEGRKSSQSKPGLTRNQSSKTTLQRKQSQVLLTDRILEKQKQKERDSTGRIMIRANSIDKMEPKHNVLQRACSSNALMMNKKKSITKDQIASPIVQTIWQGAQVWVTYYEENPKFGTSYMLNSNATGMKFNDSTYMISNCNFSKLKYFANARENPYGELYDLGRTPEALNKKVKIISHYQKQLRKRKQDDECSITNQERINREKLRFKQNNENAFNVFVTKHQSTTKAQMFWFSNKDFQIIFKDFTEILISKEKYITYANKQAERKYFTISQLNEQPEQIKKRMNYTNNVRQNVRECSNNVQRSTQNQQNKENTNPQPSLARSSSLAKMQKVQQPILTRSNSTVSNRLLAYKRLI